MLQNNLKSFKVHYNYCYESVADMFDNPQQAKQKRQQHQNYRLCKSYKRTLLLSHKEMFLLFIFVGLFVNQIGCDDTENFQKNSKFLYMQYYYLLWLLGT